MFLRKEKDPRFGRLAYVAMALLVGLTYDWFIWDKQLGLGFFVFVAVYLALFLGITSSFKQKRQPQALLVLVPTVILCATTLFYRNEFTLYITPVVVLLLSIVFGLLYTLTNPHNHKFSFSGIPMFRSIDLPLLKWGQVYRDIFRWNKDVNKDIVRRILIGLAISLPIVIIFGYMFAQADAVFAEWIRNVIKIDLLDVWRLVRTLAITLFLSGFLYVLIGKSNELTKKVSVPELPDSVITSIVLTFVNILFAIFVYFQFRYLFGGSEFILENGLTYAGYARKGFFQLCWVVVLAAIMLLGVYRSFSSHRRIHAVKILQTLLIAQVIVVAFSALKRMDLYQAAFGFTVLRLYVEWFMYFVIIILLFAVLSMSVRLSFRSLLYNNIVLGLLALTLISLVNVDLVIAKENVRRFVQEEKTLDLKYLLSLSPDVVPALQQLYDPLIYVQLQPDQKQLLGSIILTSKKDHETREKWQEFHLGDYKTENVVNSSGEMKKYGN